MENMKEMTEAYRRASLASSVKQEEYKIKQLNTKDPPPKDMFHIVHLLFLLIGIMQILPLTFFGTAYGYWMYKFRDVSSEIVDLNNKTTLQTYFASGTMMVQSIPIVICTLSATAFGYKFAARSRIMTSLTIIACFFVFFTAMIKVNTDSWQTEFFVMTLIGLAIMCGVLALLQTSTPPLLSKFPRSYMLCFLIGQGVCGIFNACLQLIALAIGSTTETSALFYFVTGSVVVFTTLILFAAGNYIPFYRYYIENSVTEERKNMLTRQQIFKITKDLWPCNAIAVLTMAHLLLTHPAVSSLVVSENYGHGDVFSDTYFVPTITFLFNDVCSLIGRFTAMKGWITRSTGIWWVLFTAMRALILIPLMMLCNAQPRHHLPVWFNHDWQYILILMMFSFTNGFLFNILFLSVPQLAPGQEEPAYLVMMCCFGICAGLFSPLSLAGVRML